MVNKVNKVEKKQHFFNFINSINFLYTQLQIITAATIFPKTV